MYCVGVIGNIASGKTTVLNYFAELGITVIQADAIAKKITDTNLDVLKILRQHFGDAIFTKNKLNRGALRRIIYNDPVKRTWLEDLLHPKIIAQIKAAISVATGHYCVIEIPLLFKMHDLYRHELHYLDRILLVIADHRLKIDRLQSRDHMDLAAAHAMLKMQPNDTEIQKIADDILINNQSLELFKKKIYKLHLQYSA